ncbi:MAG: OsmC family protein [Candidatus Atabeyarchaeum deiterrae]
MPVYRTKVTWLGGNTGSLECGNGTRMGFSAPPSLHGKHGVMTPEDGFVASLNMCVHMMFIWVAERMKIELLSYECEAEGTVQDRLDRTSVFTKIILKPRIVVRMSTEEKVKQAMQLARKFSLVAESIRPEVVIEPEIAIKG